MGVFITAASGNDGNQHAGDQLSAADTSVVGVGAVNGNDMISTFTSRAADLDMLAAGDGIVAPSIAGGSHIYLKGSGRVMQRQRWPGRRCCCISQSEAQRHADPGDPQINGLEKLGWRFGISGDVSDLSTARSDNAFAQHFQRNRPGRATPPERGRKRPCRRRSRRMI